MQRFAIRELLAWKNNPERKPLLLLGARQVGKTWLMKEFGKAEFKNTAYVYLDKNKQMAEVFEQDFDIKRILMSLQILTGNQIIPGETLIILDEIQACPAAVTALKYFCEDAREYHIIAAGSQLGVANLEGTGFPVGKVDRMYLFPMSFPEFLEGTGNSMLHQLLQSRDWQMIRAFHDKLSEQLRYYYFVGGMPEVVSTFAQYNDFTKVRKKQQALLADYRDDFGKHAPKDVKPRIEMIWDSIPSQLAKENKKFIYSAVKNGERASSLAPALTWLKNTGLIYSANRVSKPAMPLKSYKDDAFKVYFLDVGLLAASSNLNAQTIISGNRIFQEFKGALTEQYVMQQLMANFAMPPFYWANDAGTSEVDFLWEDENGIFPLEAKAERNLQAKSLKTYWQKFCPEYAIRTSMSHFFKQTIPFDHQTVNKQKTEYTLLDIPLYCLSELKDTLMNN